MSDLDIESLQAAWAALPRGDGVVGCAEPDEIWEAVAGHRSKAEVRALLAHSLRCSNCSAIWRLANALQAADGAPQGETQPLALRRAIPWWAGAGALAAAALLAFVLLPKLGVHQGPSALRGTEEEIIRPDPSAATLERNHPLLRWSGAPEGSRYAVTVTTRDLTLLVRKSGLSMPELEIPSGTLSSVGTGSELVWRVEATLPDGRRIASGAFLSQVK